LEQSEINEKSLIQILLDYERQAELIEAIRIEQGTHFPITNWYEEVAMRCEATPQQLKQAVIRLLEMRSTIDWLISGLIFHPDLPEDILLELSDRGDFITPLAHRQGPKNLLLKIAEEHKYSEAINTLALDYFGLDSADNEAFAMFIKKYKGDNMLETNLLNSHKLSPEKRAIALAIIEAS
jgi:hypothetical protein